jgi:tRNA dimethylallyltransferase
MVTVADSPPVIVLLGATATGKSALALALAQTIEGGAEIVNADALQVYRGFDIGTAKPTPEERARVRHHLIDILDPHERYSAGDFARRAREAIADIHRRGLRALVVGGSGLYLRALLEGISPVPRGDRETRRRLRRRVDEEGVEKLYEELQHRDPVTAERLMPADRQRILRALEVVEVSGVPLSDWIERQPFGDQRLPSLRIGLTLPRAILYDRIAVRVDRMLERGWLDEIGRLLGSGLAPDLPAFQAIGYRQLVRYFRGEVSLDVAVEELIRQTRRYAKRQETWFRKEPDVAWFQADDLEELVPRTLKSLEQGRGRSHG